jgi:hypothetical protein
MFSHKRQVFYPMNTTNNHIISLRFYYAYTFCLTAKLRSVISNTIIYKRTSCLQHNAYSCSCCRQIMFQHALQIWVNRIQKGYWGRAGRNWQPAQHNKLSYNTIHNNSHLNHGIRPESSFCSGKVKVCSFP